MLKKYLVLILLLIFFSTQSYGASSRNILIVKDLEIEHFLTQLLQPIFIASGVDPKSINIYIINDPTPNAFVAGGQNIFVHTGLITFSSNYEEIAGVLAHELGHIVGGHVSRSEAAYNKSSMLMFLGLAALLLATPILASGSDSSANLAEVVGFLAYGSQQASYTSMMQYSRSEESQADQLGASFIEATAYSYNGFLQFMKQLYNQEDKAIYEQDYYLWYSSHPLTLTRIEFIETYIKQHPKKSIIDSKLQTEFLFSKAKILAFTSTQQQINALAKNNSADGLYSKAIYLYQNHDYKSAIQILNSLPSQYQSIYIQELLADIYFDSKMYDQAIQIYKQVAKAEPNDITFLKLARSYLLQNNTKSALKAISISLNYNKKNPLSWHIKSLILGKMGKYPEAELATAEKHLIMRQFVPASYFANRALSALQDNPTAKIQAQDILTYIENHKQK